MYPVKNKLYWSIHRCSCFDYAQHKSVFIAGILFFLFFNFSIAAKHKCLSGDCRNGKGTASYPKGDVYIGDWKHGLAEGKGVLEYVNGNVYIGEWKDGFATGKGMMRFSNGNLYQGDWHGSQADGLGVLYDKSGNIIFSGVWKEGKFISKLSP